MKKRKGIQNIYQYMNIRTSILISFSTLIVCALLVFVFVSVHYTENMVKSNSVDYTTKIIKQINTDMDSYISSMENISVLVSKNSDVQSYLFEDNSKAKEQTSYKHILELFETVKETRKDICNIAIVGTDGKSIINDGNDSISEYISLYELDWYRNAFLKAGKAFISSSHVQNLIKDNYKWVMTLSRTLRNPYTNEQEGVFFIDLNYNAISDLCENNSLGNKGYVFIIDENGNIIYHPKQQLLYSGLLTENIQDIVGHEDNYFVKKVKGDNYLYTFSKSKETGWTVVGVVYMDELMKNSKDMKILYGILTGFLLGLTMIISIVISKEITKPLKILKDSMKEVEKGNFESASIEVTERNEIGSLSRAFNIMMEEIQNLMEQNIQEQKQKRKSELKALQAQIKPHFLYNTLDSIIWMAEGNKTKDVVLMTSSLAKLLRQSISNEDEVVTIEKEISYVRSYLTIQKMRYKDKLEFEIKMESQIYHENIIKLVLQPIVENAIYHGIKYKEGKGMLLIEAHELKDEIEILIKDNGVGMTKDKLEHIFDANIVNEKSNGVGIHNVQMRLQLSYGKEYGLFYKSSPMEGTTVSIRIPKRGEGEYEEA